MRSFSTSARLKQHFVRLRLNVIVLCVCSMSFVHDVRAAGSNAMFGHGLIADSSEFGLHGYPVHGPAVRAGTGFNRVQLVDNRNEQSVGRQVVDPTPSSAAPTFECADVIGKVFDDGNLNGYQDQGEAGLPSVKLITARGLAARTDTTGRFHISCVLKPNPDRGSNFILKLDERSLPDGYRLTTENPRVARATAGRMVKVDFGAASHRKVRLDLADAVFEKESTRIRKHWLSRIDQLLDKLLEEPSVLCLVYTAESEELSLVKQRLQSIKREIERRWASLDCCYALDIATRIIWRQGAPAD